MDKLTQEWMGEKKEQHERLHKEFAQVSRDLDDHRERLEQRVKEVHDLMVERNDARAECERLRGVVQRAAYAWREIGIHRSSGELKLTMSMHASNAWRAMAAALTPDRPAEESTDE